MVDVAIVTAVIYLANVVVTNKIKAIKIMKIKKSEIKKLNEALKSWIKLTEGFGKNYWLSKPNYKELDKRYGKRNLRRYENDFIEWCDDNEYFDASGDQYLPVKTADGENYMEISIENGSDPRCRQAVKKFRGIEFFPWYLGDDDNEISDKEYFRKAEKVWKDELPGINFLINSYFEEKDNNDE
jgi:hypothetical protein